MLCQKRQLSYICAQSKLHIKRSSPKVLLKKGCIISDSYLAANIADKSLVVRHDDNSTCNKGIKTVMCPKFFFPPIDLILT
jgi:hypothetical protein